MFIQHRQTADSDQTQPSFIDVLHSVPVIFGLRVVVKSALGVKKCSSDTFDW